MKRKIKEKLKRFPFIYKLFWIISKPLNIPMYIKNFLRDQHIIRINLRKITTIDSNESNIFYFGIPRHQNLGDLAQTYATKLWIKDNYPNNFIVEFNTAAIFSSRFIKILEEKILSTNLILFQSGYTSHEKHPDHKMHKIIVEKFRDNKIVFLPQTVNIKTKREIKSTKRIFGNHKKLLFMARDQFSYESIKEIVPGINSMLFPDIVTYLIGSFETSKKKSGVLFIIRSDNEMYYGLNEIVSKVAHVIAGSDVLVEFEDTDLHYDDFEYLSSNFDVIFKEKIFHYSSYEAIVTDRYHGTVFGVLADTPVVVLKTSYHKVKTGAEWLKKGNGKSVYITENLDEVLNILSDILKEKIEIQNLPYFKDYYYNSLKSNIDFL